MNQSLGVVPSPTATADNKTTKESRVERKRRQARERIVQAAEQLMRAQPIEDVTVADITEAADVGHGTFYLHFKAKKDVLLPITRAIAARWDEALQAHFADNPDPAEVVGFSARHMARAVVADPLWRWMLKDSGMPIDGVRSSIGRFAARDFRKGFESGRFQHADIRAVNSFLVGGFVASLLAGFNAKHPGLAIDQMTELLLRTLGLDAEEAARIAHQPLPALATPTGELL